MIALGLAFTEMTKATNVVLGCTNKRLLVVTTGMGGAPREHYVIPHEGMEIVSRQEAVRPPLAGGRGAHPRGGQAAAP